MVAHEEQHPVSRLQALCLHGGAQPGGAVGPLAMGGVQALGFQNGGALGALQGLALQQVGKVHGVLAG